MSSLMASCLLVVVTFSGANSARTNTSESYMSLDGDGVFQSRQQRLISFKTDEDGAVSVSKRPSYFLVHSAKKSVHKNNLLVFDVTDDTCKVSSDYQTRSLRFRTAVTVDLRQSCSAHVSPAHLNWIRVTVLLWERSSSSKQFLNQI